MIVCDEKLVQVPYLKSTWQEDDRSFWYIYPPRKEIKDVPIVRDFPEVFPEDLPGLPPARPVNGIPDRLNSRSRTRSSSAISIGSVQNEGIVRTTARAFRQGLHKT
ncbi:hypothetical protein Tco_0306688 [Tanacetum coccineum]